MSLINEALKKAQKLRTGEPSATMAPMPGGGSIAKRGAARSTQQLVLIASGAVVLVVLSVVGTFWFVHRPPEPKPAPQPVAVKPAAPASPSPIIVTPAITPPAVAVQPPSATSATHLPPVEKRPEAPISAGEPVPATKTAASPATIPEVPPPTPSPSSTLATIAPTTPIATDPRVHVFVDGVKVMGIRSSGDDSRVLMGDRVFRVNDIVDRNLGVRLTKVEPSALTFTDSNGAVYVKNF